MMQRPPNHNTLCAFDLIAMANAPSRISFEIGEGQPMIPLEELNGARPERWAELECDSSITDAARKLLRESAVA